MDDKNVVFLTCACICIQRLVLKNASGFIVKNLFVKDKKKKELWLIVTRHDLNFKLNQLAKHLSLKDFRMADESVMIRVDTIVIERPSLPAKVVLKRMSSVPY